MTTGHRHQISEDDLARIQGKAKRRRGPKSSYTPIRLRRCAKCGNRSGTLRWVFDNPKPDPAGRMVCEPGCLVMTVRFVPRVSDLIYAREDEAV